MKHEYYQYNAEEILSKGPKFPLIIMKDNAEVFKSMADEMADTIVEHNAKGEKTVFICPVGPVGQYPYFVDRVNSEKISLKNVWFINMDEYLDDNKEWVSIDHPLSFRGFMKRTVYDKINPELVMPEVQRIFPDPKNPGHIPEVIGQLGGVDICFGGIGINEISHARKIRLGCFRNWHRAVVRRAVYGEQTSEFPVSLLQNHSDINLKITEFVASLTD